MGSLMRCNWCLCSVAVIQILIFSSKTSNAQHFSSPFYSRDGELINWLRNSFSNNLTADCLNDVITVTKGIRKVDLLSLKFLDSWGKPSSGVLQGNLNQFGDFDECIKIQIQRKERLISGKYCLLNFDVQLSSDEMNNLIHSHFFIKNNLNDPKHRIPHMSTFFWGACLPSSCSSNDLELLLKGLLQAIPLTNASVELQAKEDTCFTKTPPVQQQSSTSGMRTALILGVFSLLVFICKNDGFRGLKQAASCFSLRRNLKELFDVSSEEGLMELNGIRALSSLSLLLSHKQMALLYKPYLNRTAMVEFIGQPWSVIGRTAILHTDTFLLLSGFLSFKGFLNARSRNRTVDVKKSIVSRYLRLVPNLFAVIMICTWILPDLNSGPLWNVVVRKHSDLCKQYWWRNMLFIHNYFGFDNMCMTHTHQLGIDFQHFLFSVFLISLMERTQSIGIIILISALTSTALRLLITLQQSLSVIIYFGIPVSQLFTSADNSYSLPLHRLTVYLLGVILAMYVHKNPTSSFQKKHFAFGWIVAGICGIMPLIGPYHMGRGYIYNNLEAALYNALSPILWGIFVSWTILACIYKTAGWFGKLLAWKWFKVYGKLSYSIYLVQFPVFFYNIGVKRDVDFYSLNELFNLPEFAAIVLISLTLTLFIEMPFNNLRDFLLKGSSKKKVSSDGVRETVEQTPTLSKVGALKRNELQKG